MSALTNPAHARARVQYLYEEGFIDEYQITQNALGQTLIMVRADDDEEEVWSVFYDDWEFDYEDLS